MKLPTPVVKKVVLLPDHAFFVRVMPLAPDTPPAGIPAQVELALEGLSPFPVAQLCYGYFHPPGAGRVLVYAAYRRRFTVDDAAEWADADAVLPAFAAWLGLAPAGPRRCWWRARISSPPLDGTGVTPCRSWWRPTRWRRTRQPEERAAVQAKLTAQLKNLPPPIEVPVPAGTSSRDR